jgi:hypothetical protein
MSPVKSLEKLFCREADACADWSVADTGTTELSEHPNTTNAILATSNRAKDRVFMTLSFLVICEMYKLHNDANATPAK